MGWISASPGLDISIASACHDCCIMLKVLLLLLSSSGLKCMHCLVDKVHQRLA